MSILGRKCTVNVTNPIGSTLDTNPDITFAVNYGLVENEFDAAGEPQGAYILGIDKPISTFEGRLIGIIHRTNDTVNNWVVANIHLSKEEILEKVNFMEKYFNVEVIV